MGGVRSEEGKEEGKFQEPFWLRILNQKRLLTLSLSPANE
jgi:hypothetical protein